MKDSKQIDAVFQVVADFWNKMIDMGVCVGKGGKMVEWMQTQDIIPQIDVNTGKIVGRMVLANETAYND